MITLSRKPVGVSRPDLSCMTLNKWRMSHIWWWNVCHRRSLLCVQEVLFNLYGINWTTQHRRGWKASVQVIVLTHYIFLVTIYKLGHEFLVILCVQEVVTHLCSKLQYKMGHYFLDILYNNDDCNFSLLFLLPAISLFFTFSSPSTHIYNQSYSKQGQTLTVHICTYI